MSVKFYRVLMIALTVWITLCIPTILVPLAQGFKIINVMVAVGFGLVPIAMVGLWNKRKWGLIILLFATLLTFVVTMRIDMVMIHLIMSVIAIFQYVSQRAKKSA